MTDLFSIPEDEDTHSLFRHPIKIGPYQAILDTWGWEGIQGWSFVFDREEVNRLSDQTLLSLVKDLAPNPMTEGSPTVKRGEKHVFVNFCRELPERTWRFDPVDRRSPEEKAKARQATCEYLKEHNALEVARAKNAAQPPQA